MLIIIRNISWSVVSNLKPPKASTKKKNKLVGIINTIMLTLYDPRFKKHSLPLLESVSCKIVLHALIYLTLTPAVANETPSLIPQGVVDNTI